MTSILQGPRASEWRTAVAIILVAAALQCGLGCAARPSRVPDFWTLLQRADGAPTPGEDCAIAYAQRRRSVFLYGGKGDSDQTTSELWVFDLSTDRWSRVDTEGPQPPPREDHTLIFDEMNGTLVLFGGEDGKTSHDTYLFDLKAERWHDITRDSAPYREDHTAVYDPTRQR
jgi:hypothetical protein